jgi:hypothetical protein
LCSSFLRRILRDFAETPPDLKSHDTIFDDLFDSLEADIQEVRGGEPKSEKVERGEWNNELEISVAVVCFQSIAMLVFYIGNKEYVTSRTIGYDIQADEGSLII